MNYALIFIGGGGGSMARYAISAFFQRYPNITLPVATLSANVISCAIFAIIFMYCQQKEVSGTSLKMFVLVGFCGGMSTFSTFSFETFELLRRGDFLYASLNVIVSLGFCLGVFLLFAAKQPS